jgi:hypothetical protein
VNILRFLSAFLAVFCGHMSYVVGLQRRSEETVAALLRPHVIAQRVCCEHVTIDWEKGEK